MIKYKLKQIYKNIFLILFKDPFDLSMTFFRYQEYYESPNKKIYRKNKLSFTKIIKIYSEYQAHKHFSYFNDWGGFNIPSFVLDKLILKQVEPMIYDDIMNKIYLKIKKIQLKDKKQESFYLIRNA